MPVIALIIGVLLAAADQIIKYFVLTYLQPVGSVTAIDGLLDFTYVENRGVAFGMAGALLNGLNLFCTSLKAVSFLNDAFLRLSYFISEDFTA